MHETPTAQDPLKLHKLGLLAPLLVRRHDLGFSSCFHTHILHKSQTGTSAPKSDQFVEEAENWPLARKVITKPPLGTMNEGTLFP